MSEVDLAGLRAAAEAATTPRAVPVCECPELLADHWFDRSICAEPCGSMHDRCSRCGHTVGRPCALDLMPLSAVAIAADVVLALVERVEAAEATLASAEGDGCPCPECPYGVHCLSMGDDGADGGRG